MGFKSWLTKILKDTVQKHFLLRIFNEFSKMNLFKYIVLRIFIHVWHQETTVMIRLLNSSIALKSFLCKSTLTP